MMRSRNVLLSMCALRQDYRLPRFVANGLFWSAIGLCVPSTAWAAAPQAAAGSQLPALSPTAQAPPTMPTLERHTASVSCQGGLLEVRAQDSSLNAILRSIARCTGMRITGGVAEQRVFGTYGPGAPATILATLIDGTGSNMLLREAAASQPAELILTPRTGGAALPSPSSYPEAQNSGDPESTSVPPGAAASPNPYANRGGPPLRRSGVPEMGMPSSGTATSPSQGGSAPAGAGAGPMTGTGSNEGGRQSNVTPSPGGIVDTPSVPSPGDAAVGGSGQDSAANRSSRSATDLTPEQILQQLQKRQNDLQQRQRIQASPPTGDNPQ